MPRVVDFFRKYETPDLNEDGSEKKDEAGAVVMKTVVERLKGLAVNAREAMKNGKGEYSWKEPSIKDADEVVTIPSLQVPKDSETRPGRRKNKLADGE